MRKEIEGVDKAIMEVIRTLRMAKETLEASLENHDEKMAASTDARLGNNTNFYTQRWKSLQAEGNVFIALRCQNRFTSINYMFVFQNSNTI